MPEELESVVPANTTKRRLERGDVVFGTWVMFVRAPAIVRMAAAAGFDFVFIDMQHSSFGWETLAEMCGLAAAVGVTPIVRPYDLSPGALNRLQDLGAMGLMAPDARARADVDDLLHAVRYPPGGARSVTVGGAPTNYVSVRSSAALRLIDDNLLVAVQIESAEAVRDVEAILEGGGVDLLEVGRQDLAADLGFPYDVRHGKVMEAVDSVIAVANERGVAVGVNAATAADAADLLARGVRCVSLSSDKAILSSGYAKLLESGRRTTTQGEA